MLTEPASTSSALVGCMHHQSLFQVPDPSRPSGITSRCGLGLRRYSGPFSPRKLHDLFDRQLESVSNPPVSYLTLPLSAFPLTSGGTSRARCCFTYSHFQRMSSVLADHCFVVAFAAPQVATTAWLLPILELVLAEVAVPANMHRRHQRGLRR